MKVDTYTKIILTVIAVVLTINLLKGMITPAIAANRVVNVPVNPDGSITVRLAESDVLDVRLRGIDESPGLHWEAIKVKVER